MLFNESSALAKVFSDAREPWLQKLTNKELRQLIYLILSWKEDIEVPCGFDGVLEKALGKTKGEDARKLEQLRDWHQQFLGEKLFHPFMSDVVGNTICADLLDYLPRDRQHLGMEPRLHTRLQRYLTLRKGTLYGDEGLRLSIMVTRKGHGGQRRDVATEVLDIMRERYEMAERVYYHHKKSAASSMLAKLVELGGPARRPRDDKDIYPAPWTPGTKGTSVPHMVHLSDQELIDYAGTVELEDVVASDLQRRLHTALRYRRTDIYRTLLVVDCSVVEASSHSIEYFTKELRGDKGAPSSAGKLALETALQLKAGARQGEVLIYCPSPSMQSKVVDARLEIREGRVLPLRIQTDSFAYRADLEVLQQYYRELWRAYIFVAPELFRDALRCRAIVDAFCEHFRVLPEVAYRKVRIHEFAIDQVAVLTKGFQAVHQFIAQHSIKELPATVVTELLRVSAADHQLLDRLSSGADVEQRLSVLFQVAALKDAVAPSPKPKVLSGTDIIRIDGYCASLMSGQKPHEIPAARLGAQDYTTYIAELMKAALSSSDDLELT
jgi:hypothetical protein